MKFTTIPFVLIIMVVVVSGFLGVFYAANENDRLITDPIEVRRLNETYGDIGGVYGDYNSIYENVSTVGGGEEGGNFITNVKQIWGSVKAFFGFTGRATTASAKVSQELEVPAWAIYSGLAALIVGLIGLIISAILRYKTN